jgi:hypothetical protein
MVVIQVKDLETGRLLYQTNIAATSTVGDVSSCLEGEVLGLLQGGRLRSGGTILGTLRPDTDGSLTFYVVRENRETGGLQKSNTLTEDEQDDASVRHEEIVLEQTGFTPRVIENVKKVLPDSLGLDRITLAYWYAAVVDKNGGDSRKGIQQMQKYLEKAREDALRRPRSKNRVYEGNFVFPFRIKEIIKFA